MYGEHVSIQENKKDQPCSDAILIDYQLLKEGKIQQ